MVLLLSPASERERKITFQFHNQKKRKEKLTLQLAGSGKQKKERRRKHLHACMLVECTYMHPRSTALRQMRRETAAAATAAMQTTRIK